MDYTLEEKYQLIKSKIIDQKSINPLEIVIKMMKNDFISMHGPEHHFLDGAALLTAYYYAGGQIDLDKCLDILATRSIKMPGAMCGQWGVCGSSASIGAALAVIHETGPLSNNEFYKDHMELTSTIIKNEGKIGGPRCCKRNAFIALSTAVDYVNEKYDMQLESSPVTCHFSSKNQQCLGQMCPFH
ncbi:MAG: DUF5714 domain-containing protein [Faecalibacillus sp.]